MFDPIKGAVGVVVLEERNQARRHRDKLLRADVDVLDLIPMLEHEVARLARVGQLGNDVALFVQLDVGLRDGPLVFFPSREILAMRLELGRAASSSSGRDWPSPFRRAAPRRRPCMRVAGIEHLRFIDNRALDHFAVRALDEAVFVDLREARERRNQTDVRTFRRLDRADAAVVRRMHVADFESGALARQTAWSRAPRDAVCA